jgi:hypothetical protein
VASGGVWAPPYRAVLVLLDLARERWYDFDGWCVVHGVDPLGLPARRGLNLIHHYARTLAQRELTEDVHDRLRKLETTLSGRLTHVVRVKIERPKDEPPTPSWWDDRDEDTIALNDQLFTQMRRG